MIKKCKFCHKNYNDKSINHHAKACKKCNILLHQHKCKDCNSLCDTQSKRCVKCAGIQLGKKRRGKNHPMWKNHKSRHCLDCNKKLGLRNFYQKTKRCNKCEGIHRKKQKQGKRIKDGYVTIYTPTHPNATKEGRVYEHRLVVERILKRKLTKKERVHHINFVRNDNKKENLFCCKNNRKHLLTHVSLYKIVLSLLTRNIITFNRKKGIYELCEH